MAEVVSLVVFDDYVLDTLEELGIGIEEFKDVMVTYYLEDIDNVEVVHWEDFKNILEKKGINVNEYFVEMEYEMYTDGAKWIIRNIEMV